MIRLIYFHEVEEWDKAIEKMQERDIYYESSYIRACMLHDDGLPALVYYEDSYIRAVNCIIIRDIQQEKVFSDKIPPETYFDCCTPYGYGGFLIEGNITERSMKALNAEYIMLCCNENIISEFVRFHPILKNYEIANELYSTICLGKTITMNLDSKEKIWEDMTSKKRNMVRKAQKNGVKIFYSNDTSFVREFIPLYKETMDKHDASDYYYFEKEYYTRLLKNSKNHSMFMYARYQNKIIAMAILLFAHGKMHYHLSAADEQYRHLAATDLLLYEAACWGCEHGYGIFHLGGGVGCREDGLYHFKAGFNRYSDSLFYGGYKIFDREKYDFLTALNPSKKEKESFFFPKYRFTV